MAFNKRTWLGRQGTGLNKFSIGGATPVTIVNQPDSVTQVGDALSAGNLNDLEDRIEDAFDDVDTELATKADEQDVTNLNNAINQLDHRVENLEQAKGDYVVSNYKDGSITPSGKGKWCVVEGVEGVSRVENQLFKTSASRTIGGVTCTNVDGTLTLSGVSTSNYAEIFDNMQIVANHSYLVYFADVVNPNNLSFNVGSLNTNVKSYLGTPKVATPTNGLVSSGMGIESYSSGTDFTGISFKFFIRDLNVHFGTNDLSFLGATDSAKLATIQSDYPHLLLPSDYGTRIVDSSYTGVRAWARNLLDPAKLDALSSVTRSGDTWTATIPNWLDATRVAGWSGVSFKEGQQYYVSAKLACASGITNARIQISYTDGTISSTPFVQGGTTAVTGGLSTAGKTIATVLFNYSSGTGNMTVSEFIINQSDSQDGTFTPWFAPNTLSFPSTSLKSAGSVREKKLLNVEVEIDGQKVQKSVKTNLIGSVDVSTINWSYNSGWNCWQGVAPSDLALPSSTTVVVNALWAGMVAVKSSGFTTQSNVGTFAINQNGIFFVNNGSTTVPPSGTMQYELATPDPPTLSDPIINNTLLTEAYGRMSTVQTGTVVDGIADLGFITL